MTFATPVRPVTEVFRSSAPGTHGWHQVPCWAGETAVRKVIDGWRGMPVSVDIETFGLGHLATKIKCVSFSDGDAAVVLDPRDNFQRKAVRELIATAPTLIFHNSAFDVPNLARNGLFTPADCARVEDTVVHARLAEPGFQASANLGAVGQRYLGVPNEDALAGAFKALGLTKQAGYYQFDLDRLLYLVGAASDAIMTARVLPRVRAAAYARLSTGHPFTEHGVSGTEAWELVDKIQAFNRVMLRRACRGLRVDFEFLESYEERTAERLRTAADTLADAKVKPGHAGDLIAFLEREAALPEDYPRTAKTKRPSTTATHLETLTHPIAQVYVEHKQISKIKDDYLAKVKDQSGDDDRIYPALNVLAAVTGRASMSGTPLHQFPADARGIVIADEGDPFTSLDWAQIEPVVITNVAAGRGSLEDLAVIEAFEAGADFYAPIMAQAGISRPHAKVVLLAQLYGEGIRKLAADLGVSEERAEELRDSLLASMPGVAAMVRGKSACVLPGQREGLLRSIARDYGLVFSLAGRIMPVPMGKGWVDEETGEVGPPSRMVHKGVNYFVQGSAFDVLMEAVLAGDKAGLGDSLHLTMHDELVVSTEAAVEWERLMQTPPDRLCQLAKRTPVLRTDRHDLGNRWAKV